MKGAFLVLSLKIVLLLSGCAFTGTEMDDVGEKLEDGIQGRGKIVPNRVMSDDFGPDYR